MPWRQVTTIVVHNAQFHAGYGRAGNHHLLGRRRLWLGDRRNLLVIEDVAIDSFYLNSLAQRRERHSERGFGHPVTVGQGGILEAKASRLIDEAAQRWHAYRLTGTRRKSQGRQVICLIAFVF